MSNVSRQIDERDQWLFNASTNDLVGVKNPTGRGEDFLPVRLDSTGTSLVSGDGNVLAGSEATTGAVQTFSVQAKNGAARLYWAHPLAGVPDGYTITISPGGQSVTEVGNTAIPIQSYEWSGLTNGVAYSFTIRPLVGSTLGTALTKSTTPTLLPVTTLSADLAFWGAARLQAGPPSNGASVSTITDQSGNGRNLTLATGGTAATFLASWNTRSALTMSTSYYEFLQEDMQTLYLGRDMSFIVVADYTGGTSSGANIINNSTISGGLYYFGLDTFSSGAIAWRLINQGGYAASSALISTSTPYVVSVTAPGAVFTNGVKSALMATGVLANTEKIVVGGTRTKTTGSWTNGYTGRLAELLIFRGLLSQAERWAWEAYLSTMYGLAAPAQQ